MIRRWLFLMVVFLLVVAVAGLAGDYYLKNIRMHYYDSELNEFETMRSSWDKHTITNFEISINYGWFEFGEKCFRHFIYEENPEKIILIEDECPEMSWYHFPYTIETLFDTVGEQLRTSPVECIGECRCNGIPTVEVAYSDQFNFPTSYHAYYTSDNGNLYTEYWLDMLKPGPSPCLVASIDIVDFEVLSFAPVSQ